jgi:hypothetical protein
MSIWVVGFENCGGPCFRAIRFLPSVAASGKVREIQEFRSKKTALKILSFSAA